MPTVVELQRMAHQLRLHSIKSTTQCKSGHPTSCSSIAEIISVLFFHTMRFKISDPKDASSDRLVLSKGHAAPILYAAWAEAGLFPVQDLMNLRKLDSDLEGHPTPRLNFVDVGTGSLGQGLSVANGMAYMGKYFDKAQYRVYCIIGDGESAEGQIWEAIHFAGFYKLDNLCYIIDVNRLGQTGETSIGHTVETYKSRTEAFGSNSLIVDGHNIDELIKAFETAACTKGKPTCVVCKTVKGKYFPTIENENGWHGKALGDKSDEVIQEITKLLNESGACEVKLKPIAPCGGSAPAPPVNITNIKLSSPPCYKPDEMVATRTAYGAGILKLGECCDRVIVLDGDMCNSTYSDKFKQKFPERFIECYIAEQNMIGVAIGCSCRDRAVTFASTFGSFLARVFDQLRMGAISFTDINVCGSHAGVSIGEDGASQMAMEDIAMFRSLPGSTIFYPSDAVSTEKAVELAANQKGICYIRTSRPTTPVLYKNEECFAIGMGHVLKKSSCDKILIIASAVTLFESLKAYEELCKKGILSRIFDPFTIKPIDKKGILDNAKDVGNLILTVEDHYIEGGMGEAVSSAVSEEVDIKVVKLAVEEVPHSGPSAEVLDRFKISCKHIVATVEKLVTK